MKPESCWQWQRRSELAERVRLWDLLGLGRADHSGTGGEVCYTEASFPPWDLVGENSCLVGAGLS